MVKNLQKHIGDNKAKLFLIFIILNLAVSLKGRGGIILLSNVFYGASTLLVVVLTLVEFKNFKKPRSQDYLAVIFIALFLASFLFSRNQGYGLAEISLFTSSILVFLYIANNKLSEKEQGTIKNTILAIVALTILYGFYTYINYPYDRFSSFFYNFEDKFIGYPNALADLLLLSLPLCFREKFKYKSIMIGLIIVALFLTYSRGAYLALLVELGILSYFFREDIFKKKSLAKILVAVLVIILSIQAINQTREAKYPTIEIEEKITLSSDEKQSSVNERLEFYEGSIEIIADYPIFGVGSDGFQFLYPQYQDHPFTSSNHPHNLFLKIAVENGALTSLTLLSLILLILWKGIRKKETRLMSIAVIGLVAHNLIDYNLNFVPNILLLFLFLGIISQHTREQAKQKSLMIPISIVGLALIVSTISIHDGYYNYLFQKGRSQAHQGQYSDALTNFEESKKLIFPRRLYLSIGEAQSKLGQTEEANSSFKMATENNIDDALAHNLSGNFEISLKKDSQNSLRFHYDYLREKEQINTNNKTEYLIKLKKFKTTLSNNEHNIVLTDNPEFAIKIAELINEPELAVELEHLKKLEEEKFKNKFGFKFSHP